MRFPLFALLVSTSLCLTSSLVEARTLSPLSSWSVKKVSAAQGPAYCTLARQYETDSVVTFARNASGEGTIAIDFQRDVFDRTRAYPITLQAGSVLRQYVIKPANDSAIIMRTSTDASLFDAMSQTGKLRVQIDSENFTIDLSGYESGFQKLKNCTGGASGETVVAKVKAPRAPQAVVDQVNDQSNLHNKEKEVSSLIEDNVRLVQELEQERASFRQKIAETRSQSASYQSAGQDSGLMKKLLDAEKRNTDLLRRISVLENQISTQSMVEFNPDMSAVLAERETQIELLQSEKERLQIFLDNEKGRRQSLEKQVAELKQRAVSSGVSTSNLSDELEKQVAMLTQENKNLRARLESKVSQEPKVIVKEVIKEVPIASSATPDEIVSLNTRLAEAETETLTLKAERDEYRSLLQRERQRLKEMSDLGQTMSSTNRQSQNMIAEIKKLEAEKVDLIRQLEFAKSDASPVNTQVSDNSQLLQKRLDEIEQNSSEMKKDLRALAADKKVLESKLKLAEQAAENAKRSLSQAKVNQMATQKDNSEISVLEAEIASLEAQNRILREEMVAQKNDVSVDRSDTQDMIAALEQKYERRFDAVEKENIRLTQELYDARHHAKTEVSEVPSVPRAPVAAQLPIMGDKEKSEPVKQVYVSPNQARAKLRNKITGKSLDATYSGRKDSPVYKIASHQLNNQRLGDDVRRLVSQSGISLVSSVEPVARVSGPDFAAFRWDTGQVYGSAEQSRLANDRAFETSVEQYISKTASRCQGEFDKTLIPVTVPNGLNVRAADIACIEGSDGAAASILFFAHDGMFYALAHEGGLDGFQTAMDNRDRLAQTLSQVF